MKIFEDLNCWQEARILVEKLYQITGGELFARDYGLKDQVRRAAVSIMANIAEGYHATSKLEYLRFLGYASRSCSETRSHLYIARDVDYISADTFESLSENALKTSNYIRGLIKYVKTAD